MRLQTKSLSRVSLLDLLRKKRSTLEKFLDDTGIVTYEKLVERCSSIGVVPPSVEQFHKAMGSPMTHEVSSPTEGVIVLAPLPDLPEVQDDSQVSQEEESISELPETAPKTPRKKRKNQDNV